MTQCVLNAAYNCHYYYSLLLHIFMHCTHSFVLHDSMLAWYMLRLCVCQSVCVSVTSQNSIKKAKVPPRKNAIQ